ncbi:universal stress protein [Candidatus Sumerlaeota bacterium]
MIRSALIPLDGSPSSERAVELAVKLTRFEKIKLYGLGIIDEPGITRPAGAAPGGSAFKEERDEALLEDAQARVDQFLARFKSQCEEEDVPHETRIVAENPYQAVVDQAELHDLIIIGRQTNFFFETEEQTGKTFRQLVHDSPRPVLATAETLPELTDDVLICYDGSNQAARALQMFTALFVHHAPNIHIITVAETKRRAEDICRRAAIFLEEHGACVCSHPLELDGKPWGAILGQVEVLKPRMLVLGAYGKSGLRKYFFGSTTAEMIEECAHPLFIYH